MSQCQFCICFPFVMIYYTVDRLVHRTSAILGHAHINNTFIKYMNRTKPKSMVATTIKHSSTESQRANNKRAVKCKPETAGENNVSSNCNNEQMPLTYKHRKVFTVKC